MLVKVTAAMRKDSIRSSLLYKEQLHLYSFLASLHDTSKDVPDDQFHQPHATASARRKSRSVQGWMYYFGTNLENRFSVKDFWPTQEQSHKIPYEKEEIKAEIERMQREMRRRKERDTALMQAREAFKQPKDEAAVESVPQVSVPAS
ncbi:unnamed protein product [Oppiella nova]|uniref:Uncharacterized protein n=1 Tax=Oppiella nova TaxID=334625 RepID=A0A7R9M6W5_9ACAR|nr:unnamed protein product [Oppiella nova]CAG2171903.1 unnamed protein product [Oppiella nova]